MFTRLLLAGAVLLAAAPAAHRPHAATPDDEAAVRAALNHYLQGHATGLGSEFQKGMHPQGTMYFLREGKLVLRTFPDYYGGAAGKPAADEAQRRRRIDFVDITGNAAVAKIVLEYPGVTLTDYMSLLKVEGTWMIVAKSFHAERQAS